MSLSQVYNNLVAVRNKITSALQDRGISGTGSMTLNDCAQLVSQLPYSGGVTVDDTTLQNFMAISGAVFYNSEGVRTTGTMPQAQRTVSGNSVIVSPGYIASTVYTSVPVAGSPVVVGNAVHISSGWVQSASTFLIGSAIAEQYIIPGVADRIISAGAYLQGDQIVVGEPNLTASNIVSGVSIFGVQGSFNPGSAFSGVDVTQSDVKAGVSFYNSLGVLQTGTIMPASSYISGGSAVVTSGYLDSQMTLVVGSGMTVTPQLLVSGYTAISSGQVITGTMPEAQINVSANSVTIASGYVSSAVTEVIPSMQEYITLSANLVNIPSGYLSSGVAFYVGSALQATSYTPAVSNQIISSGYYLAGNQTILGDTNLVGSNIVAGVTIFGVSGTHQDTSSNSFDFSQATATDSDILAGKSAYGADGTLMSGTISTVSAVLNGNVVTISNGYIESDSFQVGTAKASATYTPSTEDQIISSGYYLTGDQTILGDANLVASNIVSGITIFGVSGTYQVSCSGGVNVADTTAEADKVLSGYLFHNSLGAVTTGSIPTVTATLNGATVTIPQGYIESATIQIPAGGSATVIDNVIHIPSGYRAVSDSIEIGSAKSSQSYTPSTTAQVISAGQYLTGDQNILGDANLVGSNIVSGVTIFGVQGTHAGGGSSMDFYKCTYVNSDSWGGYKALLSNGAYSFESDSTQGLYYGTGFTPAVNGIYSADAMISIARLYTGWEAPAGYVFYAPLSTSAAIAESGQSLTVTGSPVSTVYLGVPCMQFSGSDYIQAANTSIPYSESPFSISMWINIAANPAQDTGIIGIGTNNQGCLLSVVYNATGIDLAAGGPDYGWGGAGVSPATVGFNGTWKHVAVIFGQGEYGQRLGSVYIDGVLAQSGTFNYAEWAYENTPEFYIGAYYPNTIPNLTGYLASVRIYSRVLSEAEITTLAAEFTPAT